MPTIIHTTVNNGHPLASPITVAMPDHGSDTVFPIEEAPSVVAAQSRSSAVPRRRMDRRDIAEDMIQSRNAAWNEFWSWWRHFSRTWRMQLYRLRWKNVHRRRQRQGPASCRRKFRGTCRRLHHCLTISWMIDRHTGMLDEQIFQWARCYDSLLRIPNKARRRSDQPALFHARVGKLLGLRGHITQSTLFTAHWTIVIIAQQKVADVEVRAAETLKIG